MRIESLAYGCAGRRNFVLDVCSIEELLNVCAMKAWKACRSSVREMLQERIRLLCTLHFLFKAMFREKAPIWRSAQISELNLLKERDWM